MLITSCLRINFQKVFKMAVPSGSMIQNEHITYETEEMPSSRRCFSKKDRKKRARISDSEDEFTPTKAKNGRTHFRINELLKAYEQSHLINHKNKSLQFVPEAVKDLFIPYIMHLQTINNNFRLINHLFKTNKKLVTPQLNDKFQKIVEKTETSVNKFTNDLIDTLATNQGNDSVYESMKAACKDPIIQLDKLQDSEMPKQNEAPKQAETYDDFIDSDIDLQINEFYDDAFGDFKCAEENQSHDVKKYESSSCDAGSNSNQYIKKRELSDVTQQKEFLKNLKYDDDGYLVIHTDGCCLSNGKNGAQAGIGVWFNENHPLNIALPVKGPATNNNAEIQAATKAIVAASSINAKKVRICTDSMFLINCMTTWIHRWKKNNWRTADKAPVKNRESLQELDNVLSLMESVEWKHIPGHKGYVGNEGADALAKEGAKKYVDGK